MSRRANFRCNPLVVIFFHLLKSDWVIMKTYATSEKACQDIFNYIELLYNPNRKCGKNGMLSPIDYVRQQKFTLQDC